MHMSIKGYKNPVIFYLQIMQFYLKQASFNIRLCQGKRTRGLTDKEFQIS